MFMIELENACKFRFDNVIMVFTCSCGEAAENWTVADDIRERRWHRNDCDFMNGRDAENEPIGELLIIYNQSF